jgi:hypothetical protein
MGHLLGEGQRKKLLATGGCSTRPPQRSSSYLYFRALVDPASLAIANAPLEEEEIAAATAAALERARASLARGDGVPHEEILRELGLGK